MERKVREGASGNRPVIILGMHRSGTTMVTRMLGASGLFIGRDRSVNQEARFFQDVNRWLFNAAGGRWDHPGPVGELLADAGFRRVTRDHLRDLLKSRLFVSYLGWPGYIGYRKSQEITRPWGWKDPRNTYTLPMWLDLFPDALVLHVYRHGVDVAQSLRRRQEEEHSYGRARELLARVGRAGSYHPHAEPFGSPRCGSLEGAFSLWEEYMGEARRQLRPLGDRAMEVRYESFVADPAATLARIALFLRLPTDDPTLDQAAAGALDSRAFAYRRDPGLRAFNEDVADRLAPFGY